MIRDQLRMDGTEGAENGVRAPDRVTLLSAAFRPKLRRVLAAAIDAEGPVYADVVRKHVVEGWGLKVTPRVARLLDELLHDRAATFEDGRTLLWPHGTEPSVAVAFRPPREGDRRECADVPMVELVDLARQVADHRARGSQRAMSRALGYPVLHPTIVGRLEAALRLSLELGLRVVTPYPVMTRPRTLRSPCRDRPAPRP